MILVRLRCQGLQSLDTLRQALASAVPAARSRRPSDLGDATLHNGQRRRHLCSRPFALMIVAIGKIGDRALPCVARDGGQSGDHRSPSSCWRVDCIPSPRNSRAILLLGDYGGAIDRGAGGDRILRRSSSLLFFWWAHSPGGDDIAAMFGSSTLWRLRLYRSCCGVRRGYAADRLSCGRRLPPATSGTLQ